jgi:hypothetical protein
MPNDSNKKIHLSIVSKTQKANLWRAAIVGLLFAATGITFLFTGNASPALPADINDDNVVNLTDLSILLTNWNSVGVPANKGDINSSGKVDLTDLSLLLSNWGSTYTIPLPSPTDPYLVDPGSRTMTVNTVGDYTANLNLLLSQLESRSDKTDLWTLRLMPGTYNLTGPLDADGLRNVRITSVDTSQPASLVKGPAWAGEYMLHCLYCADVRIDHLDFTGKMATYDPSDNTVHWTDQGIWLGSSHDMRVDHSQFRNIGNAAIRTNTDKDDPVAGVNSWNTWIEDNDFDNVWQVTTTSDNTLTRGGTRDYWFQRNTFSNLRGSLKFCSRTDGAKNAHILDNTWNSSSAQAIELCSVNNVEIRRNNFKNIRSFILNAYTNDLAVTGFQWGEDLTVADNVANDVSLGLRFSLPKYNDNFQPVGRRISISNNQFTKITSADTGGAAIRVVNGPAENVSLTNNALAQVTNGFYWEFDNVSTGLLLQGNTVDGVPYNTP